MTLSREKRTQRKKSRIYKLINRACRINIIKSVKSLLGDDSDLPLSRLKNKPETPERDIYYIDLPGCPVGLNAPEAGEAVPVEAAPAETPAVEIAVCEALHPETGEDMLCSAIIEQEPSAEASIATVAAVLEEPDPAAPGRCETAPAASSMMAEDVIVTPYGTFSRYSQESLLDKYIGSIEEVPAEQGDIRITNAREVIKGVADKSVAFMAAALTAVCSALGIAGKNIDAALARAAGMIAGARLWIGSRIPARYKMRTSDFARFATELLVRAIEKFDALIGRADDRLIIAECKAARAKAAAKEKLVAFLRICYFRAVRTKNAASLKWQRVVRYADANRKKCALASLGLLIALTSAASFAGSASAYEYYYNGKALGIVKNQNDVFDTVDIIGDKLGKAYHANIVISKEENITFKKVYGFDLDIDDREEVLNNFTYLKDMEVKAAAIVVDGKQVAVLDNKGSAESILEDIQGKYLKTSDSIKYDKVGFAEKVEITEVDSKLGNLQDKKDIMEYMLTGAVEKKKHVVAGGETFSGIASSYGIKQAQLRSSNPDVEPDKLQIGQELILTAAVPVVTVQTVETAEYTADIPYEIKYENTEAKYKGEQTVKNRGVNGKKEVVAQIVRNNGMEVSRTELSSKIISEPVAQVVLVGTKKLPPLIGTGDFDMPVRGKITSRFGKRWGRMHEGLDIGASIGTHVSASDGGTVIFAGRDGAYGNVIRINHGGGKVSVYAHLSKILVKKGTKVYKGQHIGNVGNTGRSTGPHLHFEIRVNGTPKNPLNYL